MSTPGPQRALGRRPTDRRRLANTVRLRLTGTLPPHPLSADHLSQVPAWMLGANNRFRTCGPTSVANFAVLTWKYLLGMDITVTDDAVFDLYRRSGNPDFDPATGAGDNGVDMTVMLSALVSGGIEITHADGTTETVIPLCFAAHNTDVDTVRAVTSIFGASLLAVDLDIAQQSQTDATPPLWDYVPGSGSWGGHAIPGGLYTSAAGAHAMDEEVISWKLKVGTTDAFIRHQLSEAYVPVFEPLWDHPVFQAGIDQAALAADYQACTGRPFPVPVPPPPPGPPAPGPDAADTAFWNAVRHWATGEHHVGDNAHAAASCRAWAKAKNLA